MTVDGVTASLPRPFLVLATQNPVELEGTFHTSRTSAMTTLVLLIGATTVDGPFGAFVPLDLPLGQVYTQIGSSSPRTCRSRRPTDNPLDSFAMLHPRPSWIAHDCCLYVALHAGTFGFYSSCYCCEGGRVMCVVPLLSIRLLSRLALGPIPIIVGLLLVLTPYAAAAETAVPGGVINTDTTWTASGSPYIVNGASGRCNWRNTCA